MSFEMSYLSFSEAASKKLDTRLLFLLKVGRKEHLESLAQGKLRFQKLKIYKDAERSAAHSDPYEGIESILQGSEIKFGIKLPSGETHEFLSENGLVDVRIQSSLESPVLCLHAVHTDEWTRKDFTEEQIPELKSYLKVPDLMRKYGDHIWMIQDLNKFNDRLILAIKKLEFGLKSRFVRYVDFNRVHGSISDEQKAFVKDIRHKDDREFRYQILSQKSFDDTFTIDVGDLSDVSMIMTFDEFRDMFESTFYLKKRTELSQ